MPQADVPTLSDADEIAAIRQLISSQPRPEGWAARRRRIEEIGAAHPAAPDIVRETATVGNVPAEWSLAPGADPSRVLLFFHGGGYCSGSILSHRRLVTEAGRAAGIRTLALQYRLAPENPFPAALDDAMAAWTELGERGYAPGAIVLGGDSAGGGLSLALMTRLRDQGRGLPACACLLSPWTDLAMTGPTLESKDAVDPLIHRGYLEELAAAYVPGTIDRRDPRVSPLYADLSGLPPMLIQVGSAETLLSDSIRLAGAAGAADVAVTLQVWPAMIHAWPLWNASLGAGRRALADAGRFMRRHLGAGPA